MQLLSKSFRVTSQYTLCDCFFFLCFCSINIFILPSRKAFRIAEDLLRSSTFILSAEAFIFCSTSEGAFHILISYEAM